MERGWKKAEREKRGERLRERENWRIWKRLWHLEYCKRHELHPSDDSYKWFNVRSPICRMIFFSLRFQLILLSGFLDVREKERERERKLGSSFSPRTAEHRVFFFFLCSPKPGLLSTLTLRRHFVSISVFIPVTQYGNVSSLVREIPSESGRYRLPGDSFVRARTRSN